MADGLIYNDVIVITKLKKNADGDALVLDLPFTIYGQNIVMNGKDITYRMSDLKNSNREVMAKVDYLISDNPNLAKAITDPLTHAKYNTHYNRRKKDAFATFDEDGVKTQYNGADREEKVPFCGSIVMEPPVVANDEF